MNIESSKNRDTENNLKIPKGIRHLVGKFLAPDSKHDSEEVYIELIIEKLEHVLTNETNLSNISSGRLNTETALAISIFVGFSEDKSFGKKISELTETLNKFPHTVKRFFEVYKYLSWEQTESNDPTPTVQRFFGTEGYDTQGANLGTEIVKQNNFKFLYNFILSDITTKSPDLNVEDRQRIAENIVKGISFNGFTILEIYLEQNQDLTKKIIGILEPIISNVTEEGINDLDLEPVSRKLTETLGDIQNLENIK